MDLVSSSYETLIIPSSKNADGVVIMPIREYNALTETHYLNASENNRKRLEHAIKDIEEGNVVDVDI